MAGYNEKMVTLSVTSIETIVPNNLISKIVSCQVKTEMIFNEIININQQNSKHKKNKFKKRVH